MSIWQRLLDLLYPPRCVGCDTRGVLLCPICRQKVTPLERRPWDSPGRYVWLAGAQGIFDFRAPIREAVHHLKYSGMRGLAQPLAEMLAVQLRGQLPPGPLAICWVPLHPKRAKERGYNQAALLAKALASALQLPSAPGLARVRATDSQVRMSAEERKANMHGAFEWRGDAPPPARLLLFDDVLTTGSTLDSCAAALHAAGAQQVYGLTLAQSNADLDVQRAQRLHSQQPASSSASAAP